MQLTNEITWRSQLVWAPIGGAQDRVIRGTIENDEVASAAPGVPSRSELAVDFQWVAPILARFFSLD
jgi:hypothetical protein